MHKCRINDVDLNAQRVLLRVDFNIPLDKEGQCLDSTRIEAALPTIKKLLSKGARLIVMSHLGRPKGQQNKAFSLRVCVPILEKFLDKKILFCTDLLGQEAVDKVKALKNGELLLLENMRFYPEEEKPEEKNELLDRLASLGDFYVNDAFGTAHRKHTSTYFLPQKFPGRALVGELMAREIDYFHQILKSPERPFLAIVGGSKVSSKIGVLKALIDRVDSLVIGGAMAFTFLKFQGHSVGKSLVEDAWIEEAGCILDKARAKGVTILLPKDVMVSESFEDTENAYLVSMEEGVPTNLMGMDIGPKSVAEVEKYINKARLVFWNGPVGVYEKDAFAKGTEAIAHAMAKSSAITIIGGGDCVAAVKNLGYAASMSHISTGGGASLKLIEEGQLPALEVLSDSQQIKV